MNVEQYYKYLDALYNHILDGFTVTINGEKRKPHEVDEIIKAMNGLYGTGETLVQTAKKLRLHFYR